MEFKELYDYVGSLADNNHEFKFSFDALTGDLTISMWQLEAGPRDPSWRETIERLGTKIWSQTTNCLAGFPEILDDRHQDESYQHVRNALGLFASTEPNARGLQWVTRTVDQHTIEALKPANFDSKRLVKVGHRKLSIEADLIAKADTIKASAVKLGQTDAGEVVLVASYIDFPLNEYPSCLRTSMLDYVELVFNYRGAKFNLDYVYPWEVFSKDFY